MLSLNAAQQAILTQIKPAQETEFVPLLGAVGRFVANELCARVDNPAFDNSAMDGYAIKHSDLAAQNYLLPLAGASSCGSAPVKLASGTTMRIFTGAPMPDGADTVVMQEEIQTQGDRIVFKRDVRLGENLRYRGEDFRANDVLYQSGRRLTVYDLALLSAAGVAEVPVYRRARVLVVATGDELVAPGTPLRPGQIYESNRLATLLQLQALGVTAIDGGTVRDDITALRALLKDAADYDFVITSGGASVGDHDLVKQIFAEIGEINFWKAKIKPGKPIAFGLIGARTHFFALPGNPVSSLVTFKLFVEPALTAWHHAQPYQMEISARAVNAFQRQPGRMEFVRAYLHTERGQLLATALPGQGSHMLGTLKNTNGLIRVAEDSAGFDVGEEVTVTPLRLDLG